MEYITLNDLNNTIRKNLHKIPHDIDFVIGIPRSGMIVASIISEFINCPLIDIDSFCAGMKPHGGGRLNLFNIKPTNKVLVVDDTTFSGKSMREAKKKLKDFTYDFIYCVAFLEGDDGEKEIDFHLRDMRHKDEGWYNICLYEYNLMNHYPHVMQKIMWDLDGVFCVNPTQDSDEEKYVEYIKNATPLFTPKVQLNSIVTYRCVKYRPETIEWLEKNGIKYNQLVMVNAQNWFERHQICPSSAHYKAMIYKNSPAQLFIESEDNQAQEIQRISQKPVLCIETNKLYQ